jgi:hypothetical protein
MMLFFVSPSFQLDSGSVTWHLYDATLATTMAKTPIGDITRGRDDSPRSAMLDRRIAGCPLAVVRRSTIPAVTRRSSLEAGPVMTLVTSFLGCLR